MKAWIWALAWRNLARNPRRVTVTGATVVIGLLLYVFARGFVNGIDHSLDDTIIATGFGHLKAYGQGFVNAADPDPVAYAIDKSPALAAKLRALPGVQEVTERILANVEIGNGVDSVMGNVMGVEPTREARMFVLAHDTAGQFLPPAPEIDAVVGAALAELLHLKLGQDVSLTAHTRAGAINEIDARIVGLLRSGNPVLDTNAVLIPLAAARSLLAMPDAATELVVMTPDREDIDAIAAAARAALPAPLDWKTWREETQPLKDLNNIRRQSFNLIVGVILAMAISAIANTMLIAAYERTREVGMMMALGVTAGQIQALFVSEAFLIGLVGALIGTGLGGAIVGYLAVHGIDLSYATKATTTNQGANIPMMSMLYTQFAWADIVQAIAIGIAASVLAAYLPARQLARLDPVVALRQD